MRRLYSVVAHVAAMGCSSKTASRDAIACVLLGQERNELDDQAVKPRLHTTKVASV